MAIIIISFWQGGNIGQIIKGTKEYKSLFNIFLRKKVII